MTVLSVSSAPLVSKLGFYGLDQKVTRRSTELLGRLDSNSSD